MGTTIDMFVKSYKANAKVKGKTLEDFIQKHIVTDYIGFIKKSVICDGIIQATSYIKDGDKTFISLNSANRYLFFVMKLIENYTDIEIKIDDEHTVDYYYDELNKIGAIEVILSAIPKSEYSEFSTLLNMKLDDFMDNEYSITALLYNFKQSLSLSEDVINSVIEEIKKQAKEN